MALNPVVLIAAGIATLIGLLVVAYAKFEGFRNAVNFMINGVISAFENLANAFVTAINIIISGINLVKPGSDIAKLEKVQFGRLGQTRTGAGVGGLGGGLMNEMKGVPRMADGGIIRHSPGGTLALIGEGGRDEAVIPLDRMGGMGTNVTINVNGGDPNAVVDALRRYMQLNGSVPIRVS
jgi:hypothetical protein